MWSVSSIGVATVIILGDGASSGTIAIDASNRHILIGEPSSDYNGTAQVMYVGFMKILFAQTLNINRIIHLFFFFFTFLRHSVLFKAEVTFVNLSGVFKFRL